MGNGRRRRIASRLWELHYSKRQRLESTVSRAVWILTGVSACLILVALTAGFIGGIKSNYLMAVDVQQPDDHYRIDGYKITFLPESHPEMEGNFGFTYPYSDHDIYIRKGMGLNQVETTCNHELMHNLGIGEEHHRFIEMNEHDVYSPVCRKLVEKIRGERNAWW